MKLTHKLIILWLICLAYAFIMKGCEAQELTASWYSVASLKAEGTWKTSKGVMADGKCFSDSGFTCATRLYPLGTCLRISSIETGKWVVVEVTDRVGARFAKTRIDLTPMAFLRLAELKKGVVAVNVEEIK